MSSSCIIAIDFGTAYSGYAYFLNVKNKEVQRMKRWERRAGPDTAKTPTCVLFDHNGQFLQFGYKARDTYYDISKNTDAYFYFRDFKMELYKQRISKELVIKDVNKKGMSAMKVFSAALSFLKEDALKTVDRETQGRTSDLDFTWVLTVPAIWDNPARQFMREAAVQAGMELSSQKLLIALESEAASVWCRQLPAEDFLSDSDDAADATLSPGTQYIVVDCGGGTIDITVHEVLEGGALKELHKASGNDKGGRTVDRKFTQCLRQFFCDGLWEEYERDHPKEAQLFMEDFSSFRQGDHSHVRELEFGVRFKDMIEKRKKKKYPLFNLTDGVTFHMKPFSTKLEISEQRMKSFFHKTLGHITDRISDIVQKHKGVRYILLVGGLSSSHMLRDHVQREFGDKAKVLCPKNPQEAILKGAVMFARDQSVIRSRKSAFTYGFSKIMRFDPTKHKPGKKVVTEDGVWCRHLFRKMVEANEDVGWDESREFSLYPLEGDQEKMSFDFYRTKKKDPTYVDESGVEGPVASCDVPMPRVSRGMDHEIKLKIYFGATTITAEATDVQTGSTDSVRMDFKTQLPAFSPAPNAGTGSSFPNGSASQHNYPPTPPTPPDTPTPPSSRPPIRLSFRRSDVELPPAVTHPSVPSDPPTPTSSHYSRQQKLRPGEMQSSPTATHPPVPSDQPTPASSRAPVRQSFRPADVEPPSNAKHRPVPTDAPTPTSSRTPVRQSFRPADVEPLSNAKHRPVPTDTPTPTSSRAPVRQSSRHGVSEVNSTTKHQPVPTDAPTSTSTNSSRQQKSRPGEIQSSPPVPSDQPMPTSTRTQVRQSFRPADVEPPSNAKHRPVPTDPTTPTSTNSSRQQKFRPGEIQSSPTAKPPPVPNDPPTPTSTRTPVRQNSRSGVSEATSTTKHPPVLTDAPTPTSTNSSRPQKFRPREIRSSPTATHPPVPNDPPTPTSSNPDENELPVTLI